MKKATLGLAAITLCLGLAACDNNDERLSETQDLNSMESPAAGNPPATTPEDQATQPGYGTGGSMSGQPPQESGAMPGSQNQPMGTPEGETQQP